MDNNDNIMLKSWCATFVRRWHSNPLLSDTYDPDGHHQHRCTILLLHLWPYSTREAIIDCLTHDQGEIDAGDMPHPAKTKHPELRDILVEIEDESLVEQGFGKEINSIDWDRRKFVDYLDAYIWMLKNKPRMRKLPTWKDHRTTLLSWASSLEVGIKVQTLLEDSEQLFV